jgi:hypothetical protein
MLSTGQLNFQMSEINNSSTLSSCTATSAVCIGRWCQMVYFQTKSQFGIVNEDFGKFYGHLIFFLLPFGIFNSDLVHFPRLGMLYQEKSGNPGQTTVPQGCQIFLGPNIQNWENKPSGNPAVPQPRQKTFFSFVFHTFDTCV